MAAPSTPANHHEKRLQLQFSDGRTHRLHWFVHPDHAVWWVGCLGDIHEIKHSDRNRHRTCKGLSCHDFVHDSRPLQDIDAWYVKHSDHIVSIMTVSDSQRITRHYSYVSALQALGESNSDSVCVALYQTQYDGVAKELPFRRLHFIPQAHCWELYLYPHDKARDAHHQFKSCLLATLDSSDLHILHLSDPRS